MRSVTQGKSLVPKKEAAKVRTHGLGLCQITPENGNTDDGLHVQQVYDHRLSRGKSVTQRKTRCGLTKPGDRGDEPGDRGDMRAVSSSYLAACHHGPLFRRPRLLGRLRHCQVLLPSHKRDVCPCQHAQSHPPHLRQTI